MFTVTLIAPQLDPATPESLRNAWGGSEITWLGEEEAAAFAVSDVPDNRWDVWADLQKLGVDVVVFEGSAVRKKVLIADMDSTMIGQECIDELADVAGVGDHVKAITARAMNGEIGFEDAMEERVSLIKGLSVDVVDEVLRDRITYTPGGATLLNTMRGAGAFTALVSGGFTFFTQAVAAHLGFDMNRANTLLVDGDQFTGQVQKPVLGQQSKVDALEELVARFEIEESDVLAVGDGANDLGMLGRAGLGVALHAKPSVQEACDVRINHCDLTALLYLQGYRRDEFV
ncbi:MAG: phosphoserine phosphatase SerB [Pseudomonadota bacterium]